MYRQLYPNINFGLGDAPTVCDPTYEPDCEEYMNILTGGEPIGTITVTGQLPVSLTPVTGTTNAPISGTQCDPNMMYPRGTVCDAISTYTSVNAAIAIAQQNTKPGAPKVTVQSNSAQGQASITAQLNKAAADAASWASTHSTMLAVGLLGLFVLSAGGGRGGRR